MSLQNLDVENTFKSTAKPLHFPNKLLVTSEPTNFSPRVMSALTNLTLTPLCKEMYQMLDDIKEMLQYVFQTRNEMTLAIQSLGIEGLEVVLANLVDPGEKIIVPIGGYWGERISQKATLRNIEVVKMATKPGEVFTMEELEREIAKHKPVLLFITHGESSGGTIQPLEGLGDICHRHNCLLAVDAVATVGGEPFFTDRWRVDAAVAVTQKAIGAPPGLTFLTFSPKAVECMKSMKTPPQYSYNILRLSEVWNKYRGLRKYYYTYNSHLICAAREALAEIVEEGLENVWRRHKKVSEKFCKGIERIGLKHFVKNPEYRLHTINLFCVPADLKWNILVDHLSEKYQMVIGFGIGPSLNKALRVGLIGYNAREEVADYVLETLEKGINFCQNNVEINSFSG